MNNSKEWIEFIRTDPSASKWLKQGMKSALTRDPVEAMNDAETLSHVLKMRWEETRAKGKF